MQKQIASSSPALSVVGTDPPRLPPPALKPLYNWNALWTDMLRGRRMEKPSALLVWLADDDACSRFWVTRVFYKHSNSWDESALWNTVFGIISICMASPTDDWYVSQIMRCTYDLCETMTGEKRLYSAVADITQLFLHHSRASTNIL